MMIILASSVGWNRIKPKSIQRAAPFAAVSYTHLDVYKRQVVEHGVFGADMKVALVNDGPFTILLDEHIL